MVFDTFGFFWYPTYTHIMLIYTRNIAAIYAYIYEYIVAIYVYIVAIVYIYAYITNKFE